MAPYIAIGLVITSTLLAIIVSKNAVITFINFIISMLNFILLWLQMNMFPYLFGHCNGCLSIDIAEGKLDGIDFSRSEKALGTSFDANDALHFLSAIIFILGCVLILKISNKKLENKTRRIVCNIFSIIFFIVEFGILQMSVYQ